MATIEALLTMGMPQGIDPTRALQPSTGVRKASADRIEWGDVRLAVGALRPDERAILQLKVVPEMVTDLERSALIDRLMAAMMCVEAGYKIPDPDAPPHYRSLIHVKQASIARRRRMVAAVLAEYCDPKTCSRCNGRGMIPVHIKGQGVMNHPCEHCEGKGYRAWKATRRITACGVQRSLDTWGMRHAQNYETTLVHCRTRYLAAATKFKRNLFGEPDGN